MGGMEMMMKSFGFDPAAIKEKIEGAGDDFKKVVKHFDDRMDAIERKLDYLIACQKPQPMIAQLNGDAHVPTIGD